MSNHDQPAPPPSNASDKSAHLSYFQALEKQSEQAPPPSNAKELPTFPEGGLVTGPALAALYSKQADFNEITFPLEKLRQTMQKNNETLFNAIMADLGEPRKMGGVKGPWSYLETIDLMDKNMADGVFGYSKSTIEATLRKHLGLPLQSSNPSTLQSF